MNSCYQNFSLQTPGSETKAESKAYYRDTDQYDEIQRQMDEVFERLFKYYAIITVAGFLIASLRILETGWLFAFPVQLFCVIGMVLVVVLRRKFPFKKRMVAFVLLGLTLGGVGIIAYGLVAQGFVFIIFGCMVATIGGRTIHGYLVTFLSTIFVLAVGFAFHQGWLTIPFDLSGYMASLEPWVTASVTILVLSLYTAMFLGKIKELWIANINRLKINEARYRLLAENATDMIWTFNLETMLFSYVSPSVKKMRGYTPEEAIELPLEKTLAPESYEYALKILQEELDKDGKEGVGSKRSRTLESQLIRKDGSYLWVEATMNFLRDSEGHPVEVLGVTRDITERKLAEARIRENEERLARSKKMESLGLLAGGVAHDLNNVLSGIVSYPELLLMDLPEDSKLRKPLEGIEASGKKAVDIVQDLLTIARGAASVKKPLSLNAIIIEYLDSPEFEQIEQHRPTVRITTNLDPELLNIKGSPIHIKKSIMNLVLNASEAIEGSGDIIISTENRYIDRPLRKYEEVNIGEYAVLSVSDNGLGISPNHLEKIFEPFFTKKVIGRSGTGLGLAVVWNIMQDHDGYIDVTSNEKGTKFELYFPITRNALAGREPSISAQDLRGNGETILVVDDIESQREISSSMLNALGYRAIAVSSGEEAVEYLKENQVDLLLLDMIMAPGINGRETYERIIRIHPGQKAVIVSGFSETNEVKKVYRLGAGQYLKKPLTLEKLGIAIKEELRK